MENESKRLYPLRFLDESEDRQWGKETWHVADTGARDSMTSEGWLGGSTLTDLMETYLERVVGDDVFESYGLQFPLMVKTLDVKGSLPLKVNVSDQVAFDRYDSLGKTALWYVQDAGSDALLYLGFSKDMDGGELYSRCQDGSLEEVLNAVHPHPGDVFLIRPGMVYSAGQGLRIVEIGESSELALNIYNWGKDLPEGESLLLEEAMDMIDYGRSDSCPLESVGDIVSIPEFKVTGLPLKAPLHIFSDQPGSFAIYFCAKGEAMVRVPSESDASKRDDYKLLQGRTILVPSEVDDFYLYPLAEGTVLLEAMMERTEVPDDYTGEKESESAQVYDGGEDEPDPHEMTWRG